MAAPRRRELWVACAWLLLGMELAWVIYLALRLPGRGPILAYVYGPMALTAAAFLVGVWGAAASFLSRPFVRRSRVAAMAVLAVVVATASFPFPFPTRHEGQLAALDFRLPVEGEWTVVWGGDVPGNLLARTRADRRYGIDLTVLREGSVHAGEGERLEDYFAFGQAVLAPAAGVVVRAVGQQPDHHPRSPPAEQGAGGPLGNHLVVEVAPERFVVLANLRQGSLRVEAGARVERGQLVAEVGSSTPSTFTRVPHLAAHLQDGPEPLWAQAVPWRFTRYVADGEPVERGVPEGAGLRLTPGGLAGGQRVAPLP